MDATELFRRTVRARAFEEEAFALWERGLITGELHLGTGEEAVAAGVTAHVEDGDALALDHRGTPALIALGVDPAGLVRELVGRPDGICRGRGGHMHLFLPERLIASSGIVGAGGPLAAGFALAAKRLRPGKVAVAFFGDGAANQGMLLESMNLAAVWRLPVLFVCKDNGWAITTRSEDVTGGDLLARARAFGLDAAEVDGADPLAVYDVTRNAFANARRNGRAFFLRADCPRLDGHLAGDPVLRKAAHPVGEGRETMERVWRDGLKRAGGLRARAKGLTHVMGAMLRAARHDERGSNNDPLRHARKHVDANDARRMEREERKEMRRVIARALEVLPEEVHHAGT
jgi:pyruvate dehydrogenase E1 component alpha subunit